MVLYGGWHGVVHLVLLLVFIDEGRELGMLHRESIVGTVIALESSILYPLCSVFLGP